MRTHHPSVVALLLAVLLAACTAGGSTDPTDPASSRPSDAATSAAPVGVDLPGTVLFMRTSGNDVSTVYTLVNGVETAITDPGGFSGVEVSPDGALVLGWADEGQTLLRGHTLRLSDGTITRLRVDAPGLNLIPSAWSPDGRQIVHIGFDEKKPQRTGIYVADYPSGANLRAVSRRPGNLFDEPLAFSPDGSKVLFYRSTQPDPSEYLDGSLWIVPTAGGTPRKISGHVFPYPQAAWSPDGSRILFATARLQEHGALWTVAPDGSGLTKLFEDPDGRYPLTPTWSPDGSRILFALNETNDDWAHLPNDVYVIDADGTNLQQVNIGPGFKRYFTWLR